MNECKIESISNFVKLRPMCVLDDCCYSRHRHGSTLFGYYVYINDFAKMAIEVSGKDLGIYNIDGQDFIDRYGYKCPLGVNGRNSDNTLYREKLGWEVSQPLIEGMKKTFKWIVEQIKNEDI